MMKKVYSFVFSISFFAVILVHSRPSYAQKANPDISANVLTLYQQAQRSGQSHAEPGGGFSLQEAELQFFSDVDPYLKASALFSIHPLAPESNTVNVDNADGSGNARTANQAVETSYAIEPEEVYFESTQVPYVTMKGGRFHAALGLHNPLHTHAYPFIDAPLINQKLLGDDGLIETGLSLAALIPAPWFLEATLQGVQGDSTRLFSSPSSSDIASVYHLRNLFELGDEATLNLGISGAHGANQYQQKSDVRGLDLSYKWRPIQGGKYSALIISAEYLSGEILGALEEPKLEGYAAWVQYQFGERWWAQFRNEEVNPRGPGQKTTKKNSLLIAFFPSEFSGFRLQFDRTHDEGNHILNTYSFQTNFTIGAHPAHAY